MNARRLLYLQFARTKFGYASQLCGSQLIEHIKNAYKAQRYADLRFRYRYPVLFKATSA